MTRSRRILSQWERKRTQILKDKTRLEVDGANEVAREKRRRVERAETWAEVSARGWEIVEKRGYRRIAPVGNNDAKGGQR